MNAKSARGASTRQRILETAAKLIYKNGVNGTSVDDVLNASGTGKSQFYHYFSSKDALVRELVDYHAKAMPQRQAELLAALNSLSAIEAWLDQILVDFHRGLYPDGCPIGNLASEMAGHSEELRLSVQEIFAHWESCLSRGLQDMRARGQLRAGVEPAMLATFCVAAIEGGFLLAKTARSAEPLAATLTQVLEHVKAQTLGASRRAVPRGVGRLTFVP